MIVDAHSHLGYSPIFGLGIQEEDLIGTMDANSIDASVVMPAAGADAAPTHDAIAELAERHPGRIFGMASLSPVVGAEPYRREARRAVEELGFVALKLHPLAHAVSPTSPTADVVFETAAELGVPLMVHTGTGVPFSLPSLLIPRARQYPTLTIIASHAGMLVYTGEAMVAAEVCENILLEPSWCAAHDVHRMVTRFGANRVLYGGDLPSNVPVELAKFRSLPLTDDERAACLGATARAVFELKGVRRVFDA